MLLVSLWLRARAPMRRRKRSLPRARRAGGDDLELPAFADDDRHARAAGLRAARLHLLQDADAFLVNSPAEHDVETVQPRRLDAGDVELRCVRVRSRIGHGQRARGGMLQLEILVMERRSVN